MSNWQLAMSKSFHRKGRKGHKKLLVEMIVQTRLAKD